MKFVFKSYPSHPWIADWTFEPPGYNTSYRETRRGLFFRSEHTLGQVTPHAEDPEWALQMPVPQNSKVNMLANGFCAYFEQRKIRCAAEVLVPEPGVLWGRFHGIPEPVMLSEHRIEQQDGNYWVESGTDTALLAIRNDTFCLVSKNPVQHDAKQLAESYFQQDFSVAIEEELARRAGAVELFEDMAHHDSLAVICVESMLKALRPAEGNIPHRWSQSSSTENHGFEINELLPLAMAWSLIDPNTAEELVLCALKTQTSSGALPAHISPLATYSVIEAPIPLIAKTAENVWEKQKNPEFLEAVIPLLRRHLQWLLHHFDPKRRGTYSWKNQSETVVPDLFKADLVTVDLAILLLTEIEALNRLRKQSSQHASQSPYFEEERNQLEHSIEDLFWNEQESSFSNAYFRGSVVPLHGFPELSPMLWKGLPQTQKASILEHIRASEKLPGQHSMLSWKQSSLDGGDVTMLQQFLVFHALKSADPHGNVLNDFSRLTIQGFIEWHTISIETNNTLQINPAIAAFIMNVQAMHKYRHHAKGPVTGYFFKVMRKVRADRNDLVVVAATALVLYCVHAYYDMRKSPLPLATLQDQMENAYAGKDMETTLRACIHIMDNYPEDAARARLLSANLLMMGGRYSEASQLLSEVRKDYPDSPGAMISLGLALQLQGRFKEADTNYYEFCYLFDEIFPDVVEEVSGYRYLSQEGFRSPPKWQEIYRYQFMHEL